MSSSNIFSRIERDLIIQYFSEKNPELHCHLCNSDFLINNYSFEDKKIKIEKEQSDVLVKICNSFDYKTEKIKCSFYFNGRGVWFISSLKVEKSCFVFEFSKDIYKAVDLSPLDTGVLSLEGKNYFYEFKNTFIPLQPVFMDKNGQALISKQTEAWIQSQTTTTSVCARQDSSTGIAFFLSANVIGLGFRYDSFLSDDVPTRGSTGFISIKIKNRSCKFKCIEKGSVVMNGFFVLILELIAEHPEDYRFLFEHLYSETCPDLAIDDIIQKITK